MSSEASESKVESKADELTVDSNQIDSHPSHQCEAILTSDMLIENKKSFKRKRLTAVAVTNESINNPVIDYIQRDNKRKKIDLQILEKENIDEKTVLMKSSVETSTATTKPETKNTKDQMTNATNRLQLKYENIHTTTVHKLTAYNDRLRLEINSLQSALAIERNAVRVLR